MGDWLSTSSTHQVCALGRLSVLVSTRCIVYNLGPAAPVEPTKYKSTSEHLTVQLIST